MCVRERRSPILQWSSSPEKLQLHPQRGEMISWFVCAATKPRDEDPIENALVVLEVGIRQQVDLSVQGGVVVALLVMWATSPKEVYPLEDVLEESLHLAALPAAQLAACCSII